MMASVYRYCEVEKMKRLVIILALTAILCGGCAPKQEIALTIPGTTVQLMMRLIPAGTFNMGSPDDEADRESDEGPQHWVTITEPFYIGVYEVTQAQWEAVMGSNPSFFEASGNPVETVSWEDCQIFINELNTKGIGTFRLPTEAEWEYACRAGSITRFSFGNDLAYSKAGDYAWHWGNSSDTAHTVGQKEPNAWGLYDMHGNVFEWCSDWYGAYDVASQTDPTGPSSGSNRVLRGSSWSLLPKYCRSAFRNYFNMPAFKQSYVGFRLVRTAP